VLNNLSAALLNHPVVDERDIPRAIALAERGVAVTANRNVNLLQTLAAAYSAAGRAADAQAVRRHIDDIS
jgi:hypothetical protein